MVKKKIQEIKHEFRFIFTGKNKIVDSVLPPSLFLVVNIFFDLKIAIYSSLILAFFQALRRFKRSESLIYTIGGVAGALFAYGIARILGNWQGFFLPGIIWGIILIIISFASVLLKRPMVAWTSFFARRWPLEWYWHKKVRPAYTETTWLWIIFFILRQFSQAYLYIINSTQKLVWVNTLTSWPATFVLLITTYLYGSWRLKRLNGPSVEEFRINKKPPWKSQLTGF